MLSSADRRHQGLRRHAQQLVDGHELVTLRLQLWNQRGEGFNCLLPIATAIVEHDNVGAGSMQPVQHVSDDAILAGALVIIRIDVRPDRHVAHLPHAIQWSKLFGRARGGVRVIRCAEQQRVPPRRCLDHPLRRVEFRAQPPFGDRLDVGVIKRVIAKQVPGRGFALDQLGKPARLSSDEKERGLDIVVAQDLEHLRRPTRVRSIVERQGDLLSAAVARLLDDAALRQLGVLGPTDGSTAKHARVERDAPPAIMRQLPHPVHLPATHQSDSRTTFDIFQLCGSKRFRRVAFEDVPKRRLLHPQAPQRHTRDVVVPEREGLIPSRDSIEKPDLVIRAGRVLVGKVTIA